MTTWWEWLTRKAQTPALPRTSSGFWTDVYRSQREPTSLDLLSAWVDAAYYCAGINAEAVARGTLRLCVRTRANDPAPRTKTRRIVVKTMAGGEEEHEEVLAHPVLDVLASPCKDADGRSRMSRHDLFATTQMYLEVFGRAYWLKEKGALATPANVWLLPAHLVEPVRELGSEKIVDYYRYTADGVQTQYSPEDVIHFRLPDLSDPYIGGRSPMQACWQRIEVVRKHLSHTQAMLDNNARPDAIIKPSDPGGVIGHDEARRLEADFSRRFARGGAGGVYVSQHGLDVQPLGWPPKDVNVLAESDHQLRQIARTFGVPMALLDNDGNRANAESGRRQHAQDAVWPRMQRLADTLTSGLLSHYDPTGRLFFAYDTPVQADRAAQISEWTSLLAAGVLTVNEVRKMDGWPPIEGGDKPAGVAAQQQSDEKDDEDDDEDGPTPKQSGDEPDDDGVNTKAYRAWLL